MTKTCQIGNGVGVEDPTINNIISIGDVDLNPDRGDVNMMEWKTNGNGRIIKIIRWRSCVIFHNDGLEYEEIKNGWIN